MSDQFPKLKNDPVVNVVFEIRFAPKTPVEELTVGALVGLLIKLNFANVKDLPIKSIAADARANDPNLKYQGTIDIFHKTHANVSVRIGAHSIAFTCHEPYLKWEPFVRLIKDCISSIANASIIESVERFGLRYINVLPNQKEIISATNCAVSLPVSGSTEQQMIRSQIKQDNFTLTITVGESMQGVLAKNDGTNKKLTGLLVDIDVADNTITGLNNADSWLELAHNTEKEAFFKIVKTEALKEYLE